MKTGIKNTVLLAQILLALKITLMAQTSSNLIDIASFGANQGNLKGYYYLPQNYTANLPLVVVCHGCNQTAIEVAERTEWHKLADNYNFCLLFPEQKLLNNSTRCFNWFNPQDNERGQGEVESIKQMIDYMILQHNVNAQRIYITGMSAGAAITIAFMASYPEYVNKGASMAGGPYKSASSFLDAAYAMNPGYVKTASAWGDLVRNQNLSFSGSYPQLLVMHGTADNVVNFNNANELVKQWCNVHNTDTTADNTTPNFNGNPIVSQEIFLSVNSSDTAVLFYTIQGVGHVIPIDEGSGIYEGGTPGAYTQDIGFYSTFWIADFFNLISGLMDKKEAKNL